LLSLQAVGWRSIFVLLAGLSTLVILPLLLCFVPETMQYKVMQRYSRQQPAAASKMVEAETILGQVCHPHHHPAHMFLHALIADCTSSWS
jgi:predicted MFS family arabinose efflux permease